MVKNFNYVAKNPDNKGIIHWSDDENKRWHRLITHQQHCIKNKACDEFFDGLEQLHLPFDRIPQLNEINAVLTKTTGWQCEPVPALIGFKRFFRLLSEKKFPVATFIRSEKEMSYLQEPDIFHEIFGHCPLLTNHDFANYTQAFGQMGLSANKEQQVFLARLYWFTIEFGLLDTPKGIRIYGGGILSSPKETDYATSNAPLELKPFDMLDVLRTPYRIDIIQPIYFTLKAVSDLSEIKKHSVSEIMNFIAQAKQKGLHQAKYPKKS
jgi:phenylalanine-4-hydroxylase